MASSGNNAVLSTNKFKKCNKNAVQIMLCYKCSSIFHTSCAKMARNVKIISDSEIICCDEEEMIDVADGFFDALEEKSVYNKIDINIFKYIINQKDCLIKELNDKINLLNNHIELLAKYNSLQNSVKECEQKMISPSAEAKKVPVKSVKDVCIQNNKTADGERTEKTELKLVTQKQLSTNLLNVEHKLRLGRYINLNNDVTLKDATHLSNNADKDQEDKWKQITKRKRKHQVVTGKNMEESTKIKGVPQMIALHVYRVYTNTTEKYLIDFRKDDFPEVSCETLTAKYPELYSSFKVKIFERNFKKAMDPIKWPYGACVQRFFRVSNEGQENSLVKVFKPQFCRS